MIFRALSESRKSEGEAEDLQGFRGPCFTAPEDSRV
jgi:hypothetical protein